MLVAMEPRRIPLFPLRDVVLFPESIVPLHIFEPRYRQLTEQALEGDRRIGMVTVRPEHVAEMAGDPPIYDVGCSGFLANSQKLADGRYQVLLRGTRRFRILRELPAETGRLYRVAEVELLEDSLSDPERGEQLRSAVIRLLQEVARRSLGEVAAAFDSTRLASLELRRFTGAVCQAIGLPAPEKQGLLDADDVCERLHRLESALAFHLAARVQPPSDTLH